MTETPVNRTRCVHVVAAEQAKSETSEKRKPMSTEAGEIDPTIEGAPVTQEAGMEGEADPSQERQASGDANEPPRNRDAIAPAFHWANLRRQR